MSGMDDAFADLAGQLADINATGIEAEESSVQNLSLSDLLDRIDGIDTQLKERGELIRPTTQSGRELHSQRAALTIEKHRRVNGGTHQTHADDEETHQGPQGQG